MYKISKGCVTDLKYSKIVKINFASVSSIFYTFVNSHVSDQY